MPEAGRRHIALGLVAALCGLGIACEDFDGENQGRWRSRANPGVARPSDAMALFDAAVFPPLDAGVPPDTAAVSPSDAQTQPDALRAVQPDALPAVSVVVLPDTQFYASDHHEIFQAQSKWILDHREERRIGLVLHEGDLVDNPTDSRQWDIAYASMHVLDNVVPYLVAVGNHDEDAQRNADNADWINSKFAVWMFSSYPWFGGTFEANKIDNSYGLVDIGPRKWLIVSLEFAPRNAAVAWANGILAANPDTPAIVLTHAYLFSDGNRYSVTAQPPQPFEPNGYGYTPIEGSNDGEQLWQQLVLPNRNVRLVLSGHTVQNAAARRTDTRPDGTRVHQILANYQTCGVGPCTEQPAPMHFFPGLPTTDESCDLSSSCMAPSALKCPAGAQPVACEVVNGGNGFLRIMEFDDAHRELRVRTYSPTLDQFLTDDANDFVLSLD